MVLVSYPGICPGMHIVLSYAYSNIREKGFIAVIPEGIQLQPDSLYPMVSYAGGFYLFQETDNSVIKGDIFVFAVLCWLDLGYVHI